MRTARTTTWLGLVPLMTKMTLVMCSSHPTSRSCRRKTREMRRTLGTSPRDRAGEEDEAGGEAVGEVEGGEGAEAGAGGEAAAEEVAG